MTSRQARAFTSVCALALVIVLSACNTSQEQLNRVAQVVLTRSAEPTPGAGAGAPAATAALAAPVAPTRDPNAGPVTATPSLIYALCLVQAAAQLRIQPDVAANSAASIQAGDVITAYGRTADAAWILGWNKNDNRGWVTASALGCTVPMAELMPAEPNVLRLTPVAVVAEAVTPTALAPASTSIPPTSLPESTATQQPATPTATPVPAMATATTAAMETPAQAATTSSVSAAPVASAKTATPIVIIQIVTVVVTVTAAPAEATSTPALIATPTPVPTARAATMTLTPAPKPTLATLSTTPTALFVLRQARCVVTPGTPVNLRVGPARTERLLGTLREGAPFVVTGRNEGADWLYGVTARGTLGWLIASAITCEDDAGKLPVVDR
jgi:hypothetical protein